MKFAAVALLAISCGTDNYRFEDYWHFVDSDVTVRPNLHDRLFEAFDDGGNRIAASMGKDGDVGLVELEAAPPFLLHETMGPVDRWEAVSYEVGVEQDHFAGRPDTELATNDRIELKTEGFAPFSIGDYVQYECFGTGNGYYNDTFDTNYGPPGRARVCDPSKGDRLFGYQLQTTSSFNTTTLIESAELTRDDAGVFHGAFAPVVPAAPATIAVDLDSFPRAQPLSWELQVRAGPDLDKGIWQGPLLFDRSNGDATITVPMPVLPDGWRAGYKVTTAQFDDSNRVLWSTSVRGLLADDNTVVTGADARKLDAPVIVVDDERVSITTPGADDGFTADVVVPVLFQGTEIAETQITHLVSHTDHIELPVDFVPFGTYHLDVWVGDAYRRSDDFVVYGRR